MSPSTTLQAQWNSSALKQLNQIAKDHPAEFIQGVTMAERTKYQESNVSGAIKELRTKVHSSLLVANKDGPPATMDNHPHAFIWYVAYHLLGDMTDRDRREVESHHYKEVSRIIATEWLREVTDAGKILETTRDAIIQFVKSEATRTATRIWVCKQHIEKGWLKETQSRLFDQLFDWMVIQIRSEKTGKTQLQNQSTHPTFIPKLMTAYNEHGLHDMAAYSEQWHKAVDKIYNATSSNATNEARHRATIHALHGYAKGHYTDANVDNAISPYLARENLSSRNKLTSYSPIECRHAL